MIKTIEALDGFIDFEVWINDDGEIEYEILEYDINEIEYNYDDVEYEIKKYIENRMKIEDIIEAQKGLPDCSNDLL